MFIQVYFKPKTDNREEIGIHIDKCQKLLNSFIHQTLGQNNPYHDRFSDYCISELQGMKLDKATGMLRLDGNKNPYITVSAYRNEKFMQTLMEGLYAREHEFCGLVFDNLLVMAHNVKVRFDTVVTTSPILLAKDGKKVCVEDPNYIYYLNEHCVKKLKRNGIEDDKFSLVIRRPDRAKKRLKWVGDTWNICSDVSLYVTGRPATREALYELGLGGSTGSGFGSVKVYG